MYKRLIIVTLMNITLSLGIVIGVQATKSSHPQTYGASSTSISLISSEELQHEVNSYRVQNGKSSLVSSSLLTKSAQERSEFLCENNVWSHDGWADSVAQYMTTASMAGENLEYGSYYQTARTIVENWSKSPSHDANMLEPKFSEQGMGIRYCEQYQGEKDVVIIVNHLGRP